MSSKNVPKKKENVGESVFDLEQHFVMRLPPGPAMALRRDVQSGNMSLKDKLSILLKPDLRHGSVRYGGEIFSAKLVDLPCVIETLKTVDRKTFYKTADLMQMFICSYEDDNSQDENESPRKKDKDKKHFWNHGITAPLKNVKRRRFRKTLKKKVGAKYMEQPDIEKEVKRLFRMDAEATDVKWEVITDEEKTLSESNSQNQVVEVCGTAGSVNLQFGGNDASLDIEQVFGELSSSDDEEKDVNIIDSGEDELMSRGAEAAQQLITGLSQAVSQGQEMCILSDNDTNDTFSLSNLYQSGTSE